MYENSCNLTGQGNTCSSRRACWVAAELRGRVLSYWSNPSIRWHHNGFDHHRNVNVRPHVFSIITRVIVLSEETLPHTIIRGVGPKCWWQMQLANRRSTGLRLTSVNQSLVPKQKEHSFVKNTEFHSTLRSESVLQIHHRTSRVNASVSCDGGVLQLSNFSFGHPSRPSCKRTSSSRMTKSRSFDSSAFRRIIGANSCTW